MPKIPSNLTGTAGEHFIAYRLSSLGLVAALPRGGALGVDVLVSNQDGSKTLSIQVKTTEWAMRTRGRGANKVPFELQFPLGHKSAKLDNRNLYFAFVDLQGIDDLSTQPDVYIVPSSFVSAYCRSWVDKAKMVRFHIEIAQIEKYKNNWELLKKALA